MVSLDFDHSIRPVFKKTSGDAPRTEAAANQQDSLFELCLQTFYPGQPKDRRGLKLLLERESPTLFTEQGMLDWLKLMMDYNGYIPDPNKEDAPENTRALWNARELALLFGYGGLKGGQSFKYLLFTNGLIKPTRHMQSAPLDERMILVHALKYFKKHLKLPNQYSGDVEGLPGEKWAGWHHELHRGGRQLPESGLTLDKLYVKYGLRFGELSEELVIHHALTHYKKFGELPGQNSGVLFDKIGENWGALNNSLFQTQRGITESMTLHDLYVKHGFRLAQTDEQTVERLMMRNLAVNGVFPVKKSKKEVPGYIGETWNAIEQRLPDLSLVQVKSRMIRRQAQKHFDITGEVPERHSGPLPGYPDISWEMIDDGLQAGRGKAKSCLERELCGMAFGKTGFTAALHDYTPAGP